MASPAHREDRVHREDRRHLRFPVRMPSVVSGSCINRHAVEASDISASGCRLDSPFALPVGSTVVVTFPSLRPLGASVRWCSHEAAGLCFHQALHPAVIAKLVATAH